MHSIYIYILKQKQQMYTLHSGKRNSHLAIPSTPTTHLQLIYHIELLYIIKA